MLGKVVFEHLSTHAPFSLKVGTSHLLFKTDELIQPPNPLSLNPSGHFPNVQNPLVRKNPEEQILWHFPL